MKSPESWVYAVAGGAVAVLVAVLYLFSSAPAGEAIPGPEPPGGTGIEGETEAGLPAGAGAGAKPEAERAEEEGGEPEDSFARENQKEVVLFFQSESSDRLFPELRTILRTASVLDQARQVIVELIVGSRQGHLPVFPAGTRMREIYRVDEGEVCVDFSRDLVDGHRGGSAGELATLYAVVNSLTVNFPEIDRVRILIEGEERETLKYHVDLTRAYVQDLSFVEATFL
ncbi:MAG: GerMN domain-containing protein [Acidobacteria bacterium]|nr:GerMN domain-containing protein [Acidobacteriota bacterium]